MNIHVPENMTVVDGYSLANPFQRILAFIIDTVVYGVIYYLFFILTRLAGIEWLAGFIAIVYLFFRDSFKISGYQSLGKKVLNLRVIRNNDGTKITIVESLKRNFIFLPNVLFAFGQSFIYGAIALTCFLILIELYLMYTNSDHQRLGDQYADTIVIENSL